MKEVEQITEAFSMQPRSFYVGQKFGGHDGVHVARIKLEDRGLYGNPKDYYIGYDKNGNELFKFMVETVNVEYFVTKEQKESQ